VRENDAVLASPGWIDPQQMFQCVCGKIHFRYVGIVCPCGEPFPYEFQEKHYRGVTA
jgi:hypothetical protein